MPDINLTVRMSFGSGEEATLSAHLCAATVQRDPRETPVPAYQVSSTPLRPSRFLLESNSS